MINLIKYELRGKFLTILGICLTVIMGNLLLIPKIGSWEVGVPILSTILGISGLILIFISSLTLMSDYLYNDQGYLLFTLPQSGRSIMISRLLAAVIQISIVTIVSALMFFLVEQERLWNGILKHIAVQEILYFIFMYLWTIISTLTIIYFCMVIGKVALKGKNMGKIGSFIIFFLLSIGINWLADLISNFFPQSMQFDSITSITINTGGAIFEMIVVAILFMVTSYLLEHKVDL